MIVVGITGSIATGKSFAAHFFEQHGYPAYYADRLAHTLLEQDAKVAEQIAHFFPEVVAEGAIRREALAQIVWKDSRRLDMLESILHPAVKKALLSSIAQEKQPMVFIEVPLLFEKAWEQYCTYTIVTYCEESIQQARACKRPGITLERFHAIEARQMPQSKKKERADFTLDTGKGNTYTLKKLEEIHALLKQKISRAV